MQNKAGLCSVSFAHLRLWFLKSTVELLAPRQKKKEKPHGRRCETARCSNRRGGPMFVRFVLFFRGGMIFF